MNWQRLKAFMENPDIALDNLKRVIPSEDEIQINKRNVASKIVGEDASEDQIQEELKRMTMLEDSAMGISGGLAKVGSKVTKALGNLPDVADNLGSGRIFNPQPGASAAEIYGTAKGQSSKGGTVARVTPMTKDNPNSLPISGLELTKIVDALPEMKAMRSSKMNVNDPARFRVEKDKLYKATKEKLETDRLPEKPSMPQEEQLSTKRTIDSIIDKLKEADLETKIRENSKIRELLQKKARSSGEDTI